MNFKQKHFYNFQNDKIGSKNGSENGTGNNGESGTGTGNGSGTGTEEVPSKPNTPEGDVSKPNPDNNGATDGSEGQEQNGGILPNVPSSTVTP